MENYYELLGIADFSTRSEIKSAFRKLAKIHHPDMSEGNRQKYEAIRFAYEFLIEDSLRENYNAQLRKELERKKRDAYMFDVSGLSYFEKLEMLLAFSVDHRSFNPSFALSCLNYVAKGNKLTEKQKRAIDNIIVSFEIDPEIWTPQLISEKLEIFYEHLEQ